MSISTVTSEALQLKLRQLLPSQQGFGTDLSASDTIIPLIDLTAAAEGSDVSEFLQRALNFGGATEFAVSASTAVIANTAGFYQITGISTVYSVSSTNVENTFTITDGSTTKTLFAHKVNTNPTHATAINIDFVVYLNAGESISVTSTDGKAVCIGSSRQLADTNGVLVQPVGFNPQ